MGHNRLQSSRLLLVAGSPGLLEAELSDRTQLARGLGAEIPLGWPPPLYDRVGAQRFIDLQTKHPESEGWWSWYVLARRPGDRPLAIGAAGFLGPPDKAGLVNLDVGIVSAHRGRGYATEAIRALVAWAFDHPEVSMIRAEVRPQAEYAERLFLKLGFREETAHGAARAFLRTRD